LNFFNAIFLRNLTQRAVFYFFGKTLMRSIAHKMRLASYMAISIALILIILVSQTRSFQTFSNVNKTLLSIPLILSFFLLVGIRVIINIPTAIEANWIFKITERPDRINYFLGLKKGIFSIALMPLFILLFLFNSFFLGWQISFYHCFYGLVVSVLLMEVLFFNYRKIPFACSYLPGKAKMHVFWIVYVLSFAVYVFLMSSIEYELLKKPSNFLIFYGIVFGFFLAFKIYEKYFIYKKLEIIYEEKPEPVMITLVPND